MKNIDVRSVIKLNRERMQSAFFDAESLTRVDQPHSRMVLRSKTESNEEINIGDPADNLIFFPK